MNFISRFISAIFIVVFHKKFQGFIQGHSGLKDKDWVQFSELLDRPDEIYIQKFESAFASCIGDGECISFAAGRMAFYSLLKHLKIGKDDDVILTGYTCSVMADAVLKTGASIVYSDIDPDTLGTSANSVRELLTSRTRMIVAQHSFGIPCKIAEIAKIATDNNVFLFEDCAISLGSSVKGTILGNFGDAALFSTDHSKPINTFTGGLLYSADTALIENIRKQRVEINALPEKKMRAIWKRVRDEKIFCNSENYYRLPLQDCIQAIIRRLPGADKNSPYLDEDQNLESSSSYPYPASFPSFLAFLGLIELDKWMVTAKKRQLSLNNFLREAEVFKFRDRLPAAYFDVENDIIPLRIVWSQSGGEKLRSEISSLVDTEQTWFLSPVISTALPLSEFGYQAGSCRIAESICPGMINIPVNLSDKASRKLFDIIAA